MFEEIKNSVKLGINKAVKSSLAGTCVKAYREISEEVRVIRERDPAAKSSAEVLLLYSGLHAILAYRLSHALYKNGFTLSARAVSQIAKSVTGIEIHPGAKIGKDVFIDHGTGVVIGETAEIGDGCTLYQGVTLGGTGKDVGKRHPTLGKNVLVGAGAKVLGPFTVGDNSKIAANAVVLEAVPENSTAVGIPARIVRKNGKKPSEDLDQIHIPDPLSQELCRMQLRIEELEKKIKELSK
ncbi:MAG: serine O-acetyltransferase [Clostridia bacterium]|nr:serine O-acetyltransferase [Clostridia bacterium]